MANSILTQEFVFTAFDAEKSGKTFPIDFDEVWKELGYYQKSDGKRSLVDNLIENEDYTIDTLWNLLQSSSTKLTQSEIFLTMTTIGVTAKIDGKYTAVEKSLLVRTEVIKLSTDGFDHFAMTAQTPEGREARKVFISYKKAYLAQLQRQLDVTPTPIEAVEKPSKRIKSLVAKVNELEKENIELTLKNNKYQEDIEKLFEESELSASSICNKTDFDVSIYKVIDCLNPLPASSLAEKRNYMANIIANDGVEGIDWVRNLGTVQVNYRFLIELAVHYRGAKGISINELPNKLVLEKSRIFKNIYNQVNTRYPNTGV